mmetsp:Transcript_51990/g.118638  ORF Transcript_51990/g.118638 Transcript_51990/m.118638 type:complete len:328 (-) Transcript_51990:1006-1989(-)
MHCSGCTSQGENGNTHQQSFRCGCRAAVRYCIQSDIHLRVNLQVLGRKRQQGHELNAVRTNAHIREKRQDFGTHVLVHQPLGLQKQSRVWDCIQDHPPQLNRRSRKLSQNVERSESHRSLCNSWPRSRVRSILRRRVAQKAIRSWHSIHGLRVRLRQPWRVAHVVSDAVVHGGQARCVWIPYPCDLQRRRLPSHDVHAITSRMPRQVNQNIDLIIVNEIAKLLGRHTGYRHPFALVPPCLNQLHQLRRPGILLGHRGIARDVKQTAVIAQHSPDEVGHRVHVKIRREVPDLDTPTARRGAPPLGERPDVVLPHVGQAPELVQSRDIR